MQITFPEEIVVEGIDSDIVAFNGKHLRNVLRGLGCGPRELCMADEIPYSERELSVMIKEGLMPRKLAETIAEYLDVSLEHLLYVRGE